LCKFCGNEGDRIFINTLENYRRVWGWLMIREKGAIAFSLKLSPCLGMVDDPRKRGDRIFINTLENYRRVWGWLAIRENRGEHGGIAPTDGVLNGKCWFVGLV